VPVDNLDAGVIGVSYLAGKQLVNPMIVSPDAGGVYRAKKFLEGCAIAGALSFTLCSYVVHLCSINGKLPEPAGLAMIIKQRPRAGQVMVLPYPALRITV
jgi:ribose-phosphate pyrophosphokinase